MLIIWSWIERFINFLEINIWLITFLPYNRIKDSLEYKVWVLREKRNIVDSNKNSDIMGLMSLLLSTIGYHTQTMMDLNQQHQLMWVSVNRKVMFKLLSDESNSSGAVLRRPLY